jgi:hypothetical protein
MIMTEAVPEAAELALVIPRSNMGPASRMTLPTMLIGLRTDISPLHEFDPQRPCGYGLHPAHNVR